ncbi:MAG TPA: hypothetical protein PKB13_09530 [Clostridia bacterium]|nr:hypothetical protein [Clostridia bacterium]
MERMLVSDYIARQTDEQKPRVMKALMGMYTLELMKKVDMSAEFAWDEFFESLLDTECVDHGDYVTLAPDWSKNFFVKKYGGQNELPMAAKM